MKQIKIASVLAVVCLWGCDTPVDQPEVISDVQTNVSHKHKHQHGSGHLHDHDHSPEFSGTHEHPHFHQHRHEAAPRSGQLVGIGHRTENGRRIHSHIEVMPIENGRLRLYLLHEQNLTVERIADSFAADVYIEPEFQKSLATVIFVRLPANRQTNGDMVYVAEIPKELDSQATLFFRVDEMRFGEGRIEFDFESSVN